MGLTPKINKLDQFILKKCAKCGAEFGPESFAHSNSIFFRDHKLPFCNDCLDEIISQDVSQSQMPNWRHVDFLCQQANIPFVPNEWQKIWDMNPVGAFARYSEIFAQKEYQRLNWGDYFREFCALREEQKLELELPELREQKIKEQREHWGANYDAEALDYLDNLYNGLMNTQNVNGALQEDQATKICKLSYEIDCRIREGSDFDKVLSAYDKLVKAAEFTPKNVKNVNDFDTVGELAKWLEKAGWRCKYYDETNRDIVDETIKNIQLFNQRLYTNESGIGDDITHRIEMLNSVKQQGGAVESEGYFIDGDKSYDLDNYEADGYNELIKDEVFDPSIGGD